MWAPNTFFSGDAHACTATMTPTIAGMLTMIKISIIANQGSPMGTSGDGSANRPAVSGMA